MNVIRIMYVFPIRDTDTNIPAWITKAFFGIGVKKGEEYRFSVWARLPQGSAKETLRIELVDTKSMGEHQAFASENLTIDSKEWKKYQVILKPGITQPKSVLRIFLTSKGTVDLEHVSLFPVDTWKGHENGLRKDLAQALADIHPGVFRFPGGCIVEGTDLDTRYDWKKSVGPVENRPLNENRWQYTFYPPFLPRLLPKLRIRILRILPVVRRNGCRTSSDSELRSFLPISEQRSESTCGSL